MAKKNKRSVASLRSVQSYPPPYYYELVKKYCQMNYTGESSFIFVSLIKPFFDKMKPSEIEMILKFKPTK